MEDGTFERINREYDADEYPENAIEELYLKCMSATDRLSELTADENNTLAGLNT